MIKDLLKNQQMLIGFVIVAALLLIVGSYNKKLGISLSGMRNSDGSESVAPSNTSVNPADPNGMNSGPSDATGLQTMTGGVNANAMNQQTNNPMDLLPRENSSDNNWGSVGQSGPGELAGVSFLSAGYHAGIDTVGGTLRNANLQIRSEPANPKQVVSPWSNSTIEPDLMRKSLELGSGSQ